MIKLILSLIKLWLLLFVITIIFSNCGNKKTILLSSSVDSVLNNAIAVTPECDSLIKLIEVSKSDKECINLINTLAEYTFGKATYLLANEALFLSIQLHYEYGINDSRSKLGLYNLRIKNLKTADSLLTISLNNSINQNQETIQLQCILWLGEVNRLQYKIENAIKYYNNAIKLATKLNEPKRKAAAYLNLGIANQNNKEFEKAVQCFNTSLQIATQNNLVSIQADVYRAMADLNRMQDNIPLALENFQKSIALSKHAKNLQLESFSLIGIGDLLTQLKNYSEAKKKYNEALEIAQKINNKTLVINTIIKQCELEIEQGNLTAINNKLDEAINIATENNNRAKVAYCLVLKGNVAQLNNELFDALLNYNDALKIGKEIKDDNIVSNCLAIIGNIQLSDNNLIKAKESSEKSLTIAKQTNSKNDIKNAAHSLFGIYQQMNLHSKALDMYILYSEMKESIENLDVVKRVDKIQRDYQNEIRNQNEKLIKKENDRKIKSKNNIIYSVALALVILLLFLFVIYRSLQVNRKAKGIIEQQKKVVEKKNKEITESIIYAKGLQDAILPPLQTIKERLKDSFILYKPKDIVAGDFYWFETVNIEKANTILFAAADCTGHGVPGAMVSMVCSNALNRVVNEFGITTPGLILDKVRELVIETFVKSEKERKDGMDISLCALSLPSQNLEGLGVRLQWSGANNPLWIIRKDSNMIEEVKPNKQSIGKTENPTPFTTHSININQGDSIYIFTDGYQDQFGGEKNKKFMAAQMKKMFQSITTKTMEEQKKIVDYTIENWKRNNEQVDDICVIGVRI